MAKSIDDIRTPAHLEEGVSRLVCALRGLTDDQLEELWERGRQRIDLSTGTLVGGQLVWENPVDGVDQAVDDLRVAEVNHRLNVLDCLEADLNGGHLTSVGYGNAGDTYSAVCNPRPPGKFCWEGPDRGTVEEAVEDARNHAPAVEPDVHDFPDDLP